MKMNSSDRVRKLRENRERLGLKRVEVWVPDAEVDQIKALATLLEAGYLIDCHVEHAVENNVVKRLVRSPSRTE